MVNEPNRYDWSKTSKAVAAGIALIGVFAFIVREPYHYQSVGTFDFIQYWSAFSLLLEHQNPYSAGTMLVRQREVGLDLDFPVMFWVPPWTALIMSPVLWPDFLASAKMWLAANVLLYIGSCCLCWSAIRNELCIGRAVLVGLALLFPLWNCLFFGQIGFLLALGTSGLHWSLCRRKPWSAGVFLALLSVKPHLFLLLGTVLGWWLLVRREWRPVASSGIVLLALVSATELIFPGSITLWKASLSEYGNDVAPTIYNWVPATFVGFLEIVSADERGRSPVWPIAIITALSVVLPFAFLVIRRPIIEWRRDYPLVLVASIFFAPYGWCADFVCLLPVVFQVLLIDEHPASCKFQIKYSILLLMISFLAFILMGSGFGMQHYYFWIPLALFSISVFVRRKFVVSRVRC